MKELFLVSVITGITLLTVAFSAAPACFEVISVFGVIGMPFWASLFPKVFTPKTIRAQIVYFLGDGLKMPRPHTPSIFTKMVDMGIFGYSPVFKLVSHTMSPAYLFIAQVKLTITMPLGAHPQPAFFGFFDLYPKSEHVHHVSQIEGLLNAL